MGHLCGRAVGHLNERSHLTRLYSVSTACQGRRSEKVVWVGEGKGGGGGGEWKVWL